VRTWDRIFPDVLPDVLGCPELTVERHILRAAQDFCARTRCWRQDLDPITTDGTSELDIDYPDRAEGVKLMAATLGGEDIGVEAADNTRMGDRLRGSQGLTRVRTDNLRTVLLMPTQAAGAQLVLNMVLKPGDESTGLPDDIVDRYGSTIALGALSTLLKVNKAEWANPALATDKKQEYEAQRARIATAVWRAFSSARPRARGMFF
jgi:hypothetical protein